jgi:hypothetical protein
MLNKKNLTVKAILSFDKIRLTLIPNTAILIFARTPEQEALSKKWLKGGLYAHNLSLARLLLDQALQKARLSKLPVIVIDSGNQKGVTFGERFSNAIADVFNMGYDNVIAVGTDCPRLRTTTILQAYRQLQRKRMVIGPDLRGGAYLLAFNREIFVPAKFENLEWQTNRLCENIQKYTVGIGSGFEILPYLGDFHQYISRRITNPLRLFLNSACLAFISSLVSALKKSTAAGFLQLTIPPVSLASLKAPPAF